MQAFLDAVISALPPAEAGRPLLRPLADANAAALLLPLLRLRLLDSGMEDVLLCVPCCILI